MTFILEEKSYPDCFSRVGFGSISGFPLQSELDFFLRFGGVFFREKGGGQITPPRSPPLGEGGGGLGIL